MSLGLGGHTKRQTIPVTYRIPKVDCNRVTIPDITNIVPMISLLDTRSSPKHMEEVIMRGIDTVLPNIVK